MISFVFVILSVLAITFAQKETVNGRIVSAMIYYLGSEMYSFNLVVTDYQADYKFEFLQEFLPKAPSAERQVESFTAFDSSTRLFSVVCPDYPSTASATFWTSTINNDVTSATPVKTSVEIKYPVSRSPEPLNVAHLKMTRLINGPSGKLFAVFSNGEVHAVDLDAGAFSFQYSLISDEALLDVSHASTEWGHVYDPEANTLWSIAMSGINWFLMSSDPEKKTVSKWTQMSMPQGDNSGFSPEQTVNMHMAKLDDNAPAKLLVMLESLPNVGFDQVNLLDTTTGQLDPIESNLMSEGILFACDTGVNACDKWRVSAFDPVYKRLYFQGHSVTEEDAGELRLFEIGFSYTTNGKLTWYTNPKGSLAFGYSGFQFIPIV